jgi:uncharacterized heparinase superfamily protein
LAAGVSNTGDAVIRDRQGYVSLHDLPTRIGRRLRALRVRARFRFGIPEPDLGDIDLAKHFHHPIDATQKVLLTERYRELFPDTVQMELTEAHRLVRHRFNILGHRVDQGERIAWSLDPVSGVDWSHGFSPDIAYRGAERLGDIKLPWELNKHQYFFTLGKAAWLTSDQSPAVEIVRQIGHWIEDNPYLRGINWIGGLEIGMRAMSWIMVFPFYADCCDASFRRRLAGSLAQHMLFVEEHLSTGRFANNHLIGEAAALVAGGLFLDCRQSARWLAKGLALLEQEMERQVTPDGVHVERSIAYHRFILDQYHVVSGLLGANGRSFSAPTLRGIERMTDFLLDLLSPDGSAPAFGDGDDSRGLWTHADCATDYRALLALGAVLFNRGDFKAVAGGVTEEVLWLLGNEGVSKFQELTPHPPDHTSAAYPNGGYYVMRGGWGTSDPQLVFDCGPIGHGPAGHGHADALSFYLYANGYRFLVDSGTFSYNLDYQWRDAFRSTRAHNTVVVDGVDQSIPRDRMSWKSTAAARCIKWVTTPWFDLVAGEHDGYRRLRDPVMHQRVVVFLKPDTWWILDHLDGSGAHSLEMFLHLQPDCSVEVQAGPARVVLRSPDDARLYAWVFDAAGNACLPEVLTGSDEERAAWFSPGYGTRVPTKALKIRRGFEGQATVFTCFSTSNAGFQPLADQDGAVGVAIRRGEGSKETLFYRLHKDWPAGAEGVHFDGEFLYCRTLGGTTTALSAGDFCSLSVAGLLEVRSPVPVESLVLHDGFCEIVVAVGHANGLQIRARERLQLLVNGRPASFGGLAPESRLETP